MNSYIVEINGERFTVHAHTADEAERLALATYTGFVTSVTIRLADERAVGADLLTTDARKGK